MIIFNFLDKNLNRKSALLFFVSAFVIGAGFFCAFFASEKASAQNASAVTQATPSQIVRVGNFPIGERLTYTISFGTFANAGYAETYVVSRGRLAEKDAVELRSRIKTSDLVSAAFYLVDESRTTFAASESGRPLYIKKTLNSGVMPQDFTQNYLTAPASGFDFLTLVYQARMTGGNGSFPLIDDDKSYNVNFLPGAVETVKTDAGNFETNVSTAVSAFLDEKGFKDFRINFSTDEQKIPVQVRFKTAKGEFKAVLSSRQFIVEEIVPTQPTPVAAITPRNTPTPIPTATPYIDNQPLLQELPFDLGETLDYQITQNGQAAGTLKLQAQERKQFLGQDSLLLTATATGAAGGNTIFRVGDTVKARVNPDTIAPQQIEMKFTGTLSSFNQTTQFDQRTGSATLSGGNRIDVPVGTHSLLSLIYAIRSFNLKPSKDRQNPINDTRVAVFWDTQPYVFTLVPSEGDILNSRGEKISAQMIAVNTGSPQLDQLSLRIWLTNDEKRLPVRFTIGGYQADLVSETIVKPIGAP